MTWIPLLHKKSYVSTAFHEFYHMVNTQYQSRLQVWQTDNAMAFMDTSIGNFLTQHGIRHQTSCTYTLQQNRQILEVVRACLFGMNMPRFYWGGGC